MLKKKYRLPIQETIKKNGRTIRTPFFLIKVFPNNLPHSRFGVIVSKKVAKEATARNRLKRIIFSCLDPKAKAGADFLIILSPKIKDLPKEEIIKNLKEVFNNN